MTTALAVAHPQPLARLEFSTEQRQLIRDTYANGAPDSEFAVLMEVARARNLNPLTRQIFFVKRWDHEKGREVWQPQVSVDGLRAIAERTGRYEGQTIAEWCDKDGKWVDVWLKEYPPAAARVGVFKQGFREPVICVARFTSYVQKKKDGSPTKNWVTMPDIMISKCAESLALRKAFPEDTSGIYTNEEMAHLQAEDVEAHTPPAQSLPPPAPKPPPRSAPKVAEAAVLEGAIEDAEVVAETLEQARNVNRMQMRGGKYKGQYIEDIKDAGYLKWLLGEKQKEPDKYRETRTEIAQLEAELARRT